ncbi:MAG: phenylacetic acid degradation protein, partial [Myxococcota bacterium]
MVAFYPLTVTNIERTTVDSVVLTLQPPAHEEETFRFIQGQYLTFRRRFEGEELRRSYSICAGITDPELRVGVRRVEG